MAQHARPKLRGHSEDWRAQFTSWSDVVLGVVSIDLKGFSEVRNGVGTYRTCSTTLVLLRIVVGTLESCRDWDEEYGCFCLSDTITPNGVLFCKVTGLRRIH
jgi:hypothetical protein